MSSFDLPAPDVFTAGTVGPPGQRVFYLQARDGELAASCGFFAVAADEVTVPLNAPYRLSDFDGWVVVPRGGDEHVLTT